MDVARIVDAILAGPLPKEPYVAALPMYDWPERRRQVDAQWDALRDALRARGVDAPERLARSNADLPGLDLEPDGFDLAALWQHPNLLFAQTCYGPLELWLKGVRVVGQEDYVGVEGGDGESYSSAIVMRREALSLRHLREAPPSVLSDISPTGGEIGAPPSAANLPVLLADLRLAYNSEDSMSGYLALERELERRNAGVDIFSALVASGGHRNSIRMVASGEADVAAVDCKSWALAQNHEAAARELVVVGWTQKRLGLPFITALR
ncbi:MAG: phosphate/phosphite/phosphonate ABC transporter substrate-binding protein [Rhizobiaceae bacterium]